MPVTIKDIARESGLSIFAVSRVLNQKPIYLVEAKRKKILETAERLGYKANPAAQSLKTRKTPVIGLVASHLFDAYRVSVLSSLDAELTSRDHALMITHTSYDLEKEMAAIEAMRHRLCAGIVVMSSFSPERHRKYAAAYRKLVEGDERIFFIDAYPPFESIRGAASDGYAEARWAVKRFLDLGVNAVRYLHADNAFFVTRERYRGVEEALVEQIPGGVKELRVDFRKWEAGDWKKFIHSLPPKTLLFFESLTGNLEYLVGALDPIAGGRRLGDDLFVSGFDAPVVKDPLSHLGVLSRALPVPIPHLRQRAELMVESAIEHFFGTKAKPGPGVKLFPCERVGF